MQYTAVCTCLLAACALQVILFILVQWLGTMYGIQGANKIAPYKELLKIDFLVIRNRFSEIDVLKLSFSDRIQKSFSNIDVLNTILL